MLTRDEIIWGYRYVLGREPESEQVVEAWRSLSNWHHFRTLLLTSAEFSMTTLPRALPDRWVITPILNGQRLIWVNLGDRFVSLGCFADDYEPVCTTFIRQVLHEGDVFLDVGANVGWYSLVASTIVGELGRIHSFEPRLPTRTYLEKTIKMNNLELGTNVHFIALADKDGESFLGWNSGTDNPGHSFLTENSDASKIQGHAVSLKTLDSMNLPNIDVIKIDIEGAEFLAMNGARETLMRTRPIVLSEIYDEQLRKVSTVTARDYVKFFRDLDFECFAIDLPNRAERLEHLHIDQLPDFFNVAFVPNEKIKQYRDVLDNYLRIGP